MRRCLLNALSIAVAATFTAPALAQDCPPGAWFCEDVSQPNVPEVEAEKEFEVGPPPPVVHEPPPPPVHRGRRHKMRFATPPGRPHAPPPVVIYHPPPPSGHPPQIVIVAPGAEPPRPATQVVVHDEVQSVPLHRPAKRWHRRWGLNLRVEGATLGGEERGGSEEAGMGGLGMSLRFRPVPAFAFDAGIDVLSGTDWNGFQRTEMPLSLSGILFVNPKSRVQFYFLGGIHFSHAEVESSSFDPLRDEGWDHDDVSTHEYSYFGGQGGIGLEFRVSRLVALNVDLLGFVRERTDEGGPAEFTDPVTGQTTNKSGGGLLRGGLTFWW